VTSPLLPLLVHCAASQHWVVSHPCPASCGPLHPKPLVLCCWSPISQSVPHVLWTCCCIQTVSHHTHQNALSSAKVVRFGCRPVSSVVCLLQMRALALSFRWRITLWRKCIPTDIFCLPVFLCALHRQQVYISHFGQHIHLPSPAHGSSKLDLARAVPSSQWFFRHRVLLSVQASPYLHLWYWDTPIVTVIVSCTIAHSTFTYAYACSYSASCIINFWLCHADT
jgi:hypothetical protein